MATLTRDQRLTIARRCEETSRPVTAEIELDYPAAGNGASLRLYDKTGHRTDRHDLTSPRTLGHLNDPDDIHTGKITDGANTPGLITAAERRLDALGFTYAPRAQWTTHTGTATEQRTRREWEPCTPAGRLPYATRVQITPTPAYVAYVERCYGPAPTPPVVPGLTATNRERGWWNVDRTDGERFALSWSPQMRGDVWRVWSGPSVSDLMASGRDPEELLARL